MTTSLKLSKNELFELLKEFNYEINKRRKYEIVDCSNPLQKISYFNNCIDFINSLKSIDFIERLFIHNKRTDSVEAIEVDDCCNVEWSKLNYFEIECSGIVHRFNRRQ